MMTFRTSDAGVGDLVEQVILAFRQLRAISAELHGGGMPLAGQRGVLMDLVRLGPQTVATMARARGESRQNVQAMVNAFLKHRLVERAENPAHRRSPLIRLTRRGEAHVQAMLRRERAAVASLGPVAAPRQIRQATTVLRDLTERLAGHPWGRWAERPRRRARP